MSIFKKERPNREIYKTAYWRAIDPVDRAHILLVAEGVKPMAYTSFTNLKSISDYLSRELKIWITEARGKRRWFPTKTKLHLPERVYTICGSEKAFKFIQELWGSPSQSHYWDYEGKLLGYPRCCRKEYIATTYRDKFNGWIIRFFGRRPYTFMIQWVRKVLDKKSIPEEFLYLMPSQTPCSIGCRKSLRLLNRWKRLLYKYDPEAAEALKSFNERNKSARFQAIADKLKKKNVSSNMFKKGYVFNS